MGDQLSLEDALVKCNNIFANKDEVSDEERKQLISSLKPHLRTKHAGDVSAWIAWLDNLNNK